MTPVTENRTAFFTPTILAGRPLHDRLGLFTCTGDAVTLRLRGTLKAGRYRMALFTRPDSFDMDTVMLPLTSWPSMTPVKAGPFDFDHTQYRMAVPTFRVTVNGYNWGLVWCEVPSPADVKARRLRAVWGIETTADGPVEIVLEAPEDERHRLRLTDVAEMEIRPDERYSLPLDGIPTDARHPRLFADAARFDRLARPADRVHDALLQAVSSQAAADDTGKSYEYRTLCMALLGRVTGERLWIDQAIARTMTLCDRENWGYHDRPEIMGWNTDRDAGNRMLETAVVFDWLHDHLTADQKTRIAAKLAHHADVAYRVTLLQRNYWYHRTIEAHGQGLWTGFMAAAAALLGHDPRAPGWLAWARGNFDESARCLPEDGIATWVVFNVFWHILGLALIERLAGRRADLPPGFFDTYATRIPHFLPDDTRDSMLGSLLCYLAGRNRDPEAQANALHYLKLDEASTALRAPRFAAFGLLFYEPGVAPGTRTVPAPAAQAQGGLVCCRGRNGVQFGFQCGTPLTPRVHESLNFINRTWYGVSSSGSFTWMAPAEGRHSGASRILAPAGIRGYQYCTAHANLVTVDGAGHELEARWVGATVPLSRVPFIERVATAAGVTVCAANLAPAYAAEAGVRRAVRRWWFLHDLNLVVLFDRFRLASPRALAWHIHGHDGAWEQEAPLAWQIREGGHTLTVRALEMEPAAAGLTADTVIQERVPSYTTGMNRYKNAEWQPELYLDKIQVPPMPALRFQPAAPVCDWDLVTLMQVDGREAATAAPESGCPGVRLAAGTRLLWPCGASVAAGGPDFEVTADAVRMTPDGGVWAFQATAWRRGAKTERLDEPADLHWKNAESAPAGWAG